MSVGRLAGCALLLTSLGGCSAQASAGFTPRSPDAAPRQVALSGQVEDMREHGPTLGGRGTFTVSDAAHPFELRNAMVEVGYQLRPTEPLGVGVEGGLELGMGEPSFVDFDGLGGYVGARLDVPLRVYGRSDLEPNNYYTAACLLDLVLSGVGGVWTEPAGTATEPAIGEAALLFGVRFAVGSDVGRSPRPSQRTSADREEAAHGD